MSPKLIAEIDPTLLTDESVEQLVRDITRQSEIARCEREPDPESPSEDSAPQQQEANTIKGHMPPDRRATAMQKLEKLVHARVTGGPEARDKVLDEILPGWRSEKPE